MENMKDNPEDQSDEAAPEAVGAMKKPAAFRSRDRQVRRSLTMPENE